MIIFCLKDLQLVKLLDYRLTRLSEEKGAVYSRYADDLSFTWPTRHGKKFINIFMYKVGKILSMNGFELNKKKSKVIGTGGRMEILGYVMNSGKPTIAPAYVEAVRTEILKLKDKIKDGLIQNELRFLSECSKIKGKINFIASANPHKADKLSSLLSIINPPISNRRKISAD
jgi:RNA-directed DNA polymerase